MQHGEAHLAGAPRGEGQIVCLGRVPEGLTGGSKPGVMVAPEIVRRGDETPGQREPALVGEFGECSYRLLPLREQKRIRSLERMCEAPQGLQLDAAS